MICRTVHELQCAFNVFIADSGDEVSRACDKSWREISSTIFDSMRNHPVYGRHSRGYRKHVRRMKAMGGNYSKPPVVCTVDLTKSIWTGKFTYSGNVRVTIGA